MTKIRKRKKKKKTEGYRGVEMVKRTNPPSLPPPPPLFFLTPILLFSVEPDSKKLSRHGSVEIFDGAYNLTVPNTLSRNQNFSTSLKIYKKKLNKNQTNFTNIKLSNRIKEVLLVFYVL